MTTEVDLEDEHDRVRIAARADVGVVVLEVDAASAGNLVVDCAAEAWGERPAE